MADATVKPDAAKAKPTVNLDRVELAASLLPGVLASNLFAANVGKAAQHALDAADALIAAFVNEKVAAEAKVVDDAAAQAVLDAANERHLKSLRENAEKATAKAQADAKAKAESDARARELAGAKKQLGA